MPGIDTNQLWTPARGLPSATPDQKSPVTNIRGGRYGEQYALSLVPTKHLLADEGTYFVATTPTPGTAVTYFTNANAYNDTTGAMFYMQNNDSKSNPLAKRMYLDYIKIVCTTLATASTGARFAIKVDPTVRSLATNNMTSAIPVSPNMDAAPQSLMGVYYQSATTATTLSASSASARVVANASMGGITVVGDEYVLISGTTDSGAYAGLTAAEAVCPGRKVSVIPPIIVGPSSCLTVYVWFPGNTTAAQYEFEMGWWER